VNTHLLPFWYDVDDETDLPRLVWHLRQARARDEGAHAATWSALETIGALKEESA
jgi:hypothetical protein